MIDFIFMIIWGFILEINIPLSLIPIKIDVLEKVKDKCLYGVNYIKNWKIRYVYLNGMNIRGGCIFTKNRCCVSILEEVQRKTFTPKKCKRNVKGFR